MKKRAEQRRIMKYGTTKGMKDNEETSRKLKRKLTTKKKNKRKVKEDFVRLRQRKEIT